MKRLTGANSSKRRRRRARGIRALGALVASGAIIGPVLAPATVMAGSSSASPVPRGPHMPGAPQCPVLPADNVWNTPIADLPVDPRSAQYIDEIGAAAPLHPDFGRGDWDGAPMGIPYNVVPGRQAKVPVTFQYSDESDAGPYPVPPQATIEGGASSSGDRHVIVLDTGNCTDYEMWDAYPQRGGRSWSAGSGAIFNLASDKLRPPTWTSADAAGLPIFPGLVRPDEVQAGAIDHAIRVTVPQTSQRFLWPARHEAGDANPSLPPMGLRLRLKADVDISSYPKVDRVILQALKTYGIIVADNGSPWYISGVPSNYWDNDTLHDLTRVTGKDFEVVDESCLEISPSSGQARQGTC